MVQQKFSVDLSKPLAFQVGHLGKDYEEWVHQPVVSKDSPRLYENGFIELISLSPWWVVPLYWLPIVCWVVASSVKGGIPRIYLLPTLFAGVFAFTLIEYLLHRFLFHFKTSSFWGITLHYMFHGFHHKHPSDRLRLVLSPAATSVIGIMLWRVEKLVIPEPYLSTFFGGELLGYVLYDCIHYYLHHGKASKGFLNRLKRDHMHHHYKAHYKGFGVTSNFWDRVFGTMPVKSTNKYS